MTAPHYRMLTLSILIVRIFWDQIHGRTCSNNWWRTVYLVSCYMQHAKEHTLIGRFRPHIPWPTPIIDYCLEAHWACASFEIKFTVVPVQIMAGRRYKWRFSAKTSLKNTLIGRFRPHIAWPTPTIDCYLEVYYSCASFEIKFTVVPTQVMAGRP